MKRSIFLFAFIALSFTGCKVTWVPSYDATIVQDITDGAKLTDQLYIGMAQAPDKTYSGNAQKYVAIEAQINSIILKHQARPKSGDIIRMATNLQKTFLKYKDEHSRMKVLNTGQITIYNKYMQALWKPMLIAERALK